ncbi:hypothetical protein ACFUJU_10475 [Streptomyces sp. NPDC057235]|uniref:hypothetical protein n=1 Tax=Streptomyces sp. NPDC057235 TaxID=3346058 RepID=UPI00362E6410
MTAARFIPQFFPDHIEQVLGGPEAHQLFEDALYALHPNMPVRDVEQLRLALERVVRVDHKAELVINGGFRREVPSYVAGDKRDLVERAISRAFWVRAELRKLGAVS